MESERRKSLPWWVWLVIWIVPIPSFFFPPWYIGVMALFLFLGLFAYARWKDASLK